MKNSYKKVFLILAIIGFLLPYSQLILFLFDNGFDIDLIIDQVIDTRLSAFAWLDVLVSGVVLIYWMHIDTKNVKHPWIPIIGTLSIGVSFGLPIYLFLREENSNS